MEKEEQKLIEKYKSSDVYGDVIEIESEMGVYPILELINEIRENTIEHIANHQGWEESGDIYRRHYRLKEKYKK